MTTTVVKTIGASGADYTTLQSWEDAAPANYVTADQVWQGQVKAATDLFTAALTISGGTVDATRYAELTTSTGASFRDNANVQTNALRYNASNGAAASISTYHVNLITISQSYTRISNMQFAHTGDGATVQCSGGLSGIDINNCIIEGARVTGGALVLGGSTHKIRNSLVVVRTSSSPNCIVNILQGAKAYNCTFVTPSDKSIATNGNIGYSTAPTFVNCNFFHCSGINSGGSTPTYTTCYTDIGTPPSGFTTAAFNTTQFVALTDAARDFRIPTGSAMKDAGTTDSTNAPIDIAGTARPSGSAYDVGCWEFVQAAGNVFNPLSGRGGGAAQPLRMH